MNVSTPVRTPFSADTTAAEVVAEIDLSGSRVIVTGGASGIGVETARALAAAGAEVTLAVRNTDAGQRVASEIVATTGNSRVVVAPLDLADRVSIAAFVAVWDGPLTVLVNNAGVLALPDLQLTPEGWETLFATNHLGHFALALGLHEALAAAGGARIVSLSSVGHRRSPVIFEDLFFTSRPYDMGLAYGQSKTANVLFAVEATRRWSGDGITANAVHPGTILTTNLLRDLNLEVLAALRASAPYAQTFTPSRLRHKTIEQGAATSVLVATSPHLDGIGGRYFEDCNEARVLDPDVPNTTSAGVAAHALDPEAAERLWEVSLETLASAAS
jgi:NAD(P)-dependent dehydrogenase (short-subunit alcohol dehydrogenase family)